MRSREPVMCDVKKKLGIDMIVSRDSAQKKGTRSRMTQAISASLSAMYGTDARETLGRVVKALRVELERGCR